MPRKSSSSDQNSVRIPEDPSRYSDDSQLSSGRKTLSGVSGVPGVPDLASQIDDPNENLRDSIVQSIRKFTRKAR